MNTENKKLVPVEALRRGLLLLDLLSAHPEGMMLAELSEKLSLQRTTVHNLLKTLVFTGYAENDGIGRYRLGWRMRELSRIQRFGHCEGLTSLMESLTTEIGEALILTQLSNGHREVLCHTQSTQEIQVNTPVMEQGAKTIWELETGLVLAAFSQPEVLERIIEVNGMPTGRYLNTDSRETMNAYLDEIRKSGYSTLEHAFIFAMAVPILDDNGALLGALGINQPLFRHKSKDLPKILQMLQHGAKRIAATMKL